VKYGKNIDKGGKMSVIKELKIEKNVGMITFRQKDVEFSYYIDKNDVFRTHFNVSIHDTIKNRSNLRYIGYFKVSKNEKVYLLKESSVFNKEKKNIRLYGFSNNIVVIYVDINYNIHIVVGELFIDELEEYF